VEYSKLKGTYDIIPEESDFFRNIKAKVESILNISGYKKIEFPVIEKAELFIRGAGEASDIVVKKEMYTFEDRGHRMIALRPEGTASAVRLYLENSLSMQGYSSRMYYCGPMFRAENPQAGRYRQFTQYGVEYIGDEEPMVDVELIQLNSQIFKALGLKKYTIFINSIGCRECRPNYLFALKKYFEDKIDKMCADCKKRYGTNVLRILDCKEESCRAFIKNAPTGIDYLCEKCKEHFESLKNYLNNLKIPYQIDPGLVRGLDYYNRTVFEIKSELLGAQSTISAGGRYDYLIKELGGMETPASGFAFGMERLAILIEKELGRAKKDFYIPPEVYVAYIGKENLYNALEIINRLRENGITAVTEYKYSNLKKHLRTADSMKAKFALFAGEDEIKSGEYTLRNLSTGEQTTGTIEEIIKTLLSYA